jgi:hypothetical protein
MATSGARYLATSGDFPMARDTTRAKHPFVGAGLEAHLTLEDVKGLIFVIMDMRRRPLTRREATRH